MDIENMKRAISEAFEREEMANTGQLELCSKCNCMTHTLIDIDGFTFCGKCKERRVNETQK